MYLAAKAGKPETLGKGLDAGKHQMCLLKLQDISNVLSGWFFKDQSPEGYDKDGQLSSILVVFNKMLEGKDFLMGDYATYADIFLYYSLHTNKVMCATYAIEDKTKALTNLCTH